MENKLSPIEMLDKTLEWFAMDANEMGIGMQMVSRQYLEIKNATPLIIDKFPELDSNEYLFYIRMIFEKLVKDEYLTKSIPFDYKYAGDSYSITFVGKLFSKAGGYAAEQESKRVEIQEIKSDLVLRRRNDRRLVRGTYAVAIGAVALVLWEIIQYFFLEKH